MQSIQTAGPLTTSYAAKPEKSRARTIALRLSMVFIGIGIGFSLCEIAMRAFQIGHTNTVIRYNDRLLKLKPHIRFMNYLEHKNLVETNNWGFHDHDRQAASDHYRILFLGDSFLEGRQVPTESLFTVRLEKKLAQEGQTIEAINGGVPGTGTPHQYVLWKEFFAPNIKFDRVVLCFNIGNDLRDNSVDLATSDSLFYVDSQGNILETGHKPGLLKQTVNHGRDYSVLFNTLYEGAFRVKQSLQAEAEENVAAEQAQVSVAQPWLDSEQGTISLLRKWKSELAAKNIPFDIVLIDRPGRIYNRFESDFMAKLETTCAEDKIDCFRLKLSSDPFESYSFDGIGLGHFNERGHELAANDLYDYFKSRHAAIFDRPAH